jgi:hypothetical protein
MKLAQSLILCSILLFFGCGGSGGDDSNEGGVVTPTNTAPTANAGTAQSVTEQTVVTLDASASSDTDGTIASYAWSQTAGTTVTLSAMDISNPTFTATVAETLTFELTVTDNDNATSTATVSITVSVAISVNEFADVTEIEETLLLNELYFEFANRIGDKVWVLGYFGNKGHNDDGSAFFVDNMLSLQTAEQLPHHSFARLDGELPPENWEGDQIAVYGEIKDYATESGTTSI